MTQPPQLPNEPHARRSQIHANVDAYLQYMVRDTALTLRGPLPASAVAEQLAGRARRSEPSVIASVFAAAIVALAEKENEANGAEKIDLPSIDLPDDFVGTRDRAAAFCTGLDELLFTHGMHIVSVLDVELYDPVKDLVVAQNVHYETGLGRHGCTGVAPYNWRLPL